MLSGEESVYAFVDEFFENFGKCWKKGYGSVVGNQVFFIFFAKRLHFGVLELLGEDTLIKGSVEQDLQRE